MANRYWRGGAGTWDGTSTTNWSATSGGAGGASAPTSADDVFFNSASNATTYTVTIDASVSQPSCKSVTFSGPAAGTLTVNYGIGYSLYVYGDLTIAASGVNTSAFAADMRQASGTSTITTNNVTITFLFLTSAATFSLASAITTSQYILGSVSGLIFNTNNYTITGGRVYSTAGTLNLGTSTLSNCGIQRASSGVINAASATCNISATGKSINGGVTLGTLNFSFAGAMTLVGSNTITNFNITSAATQSITFPAGGTTTISNLIAVGTSGNLITFLSSSSGTTFTLTNGVPGSIISGDYLSITDSVATGGLGWYAGTHSTNGGNNTGWTFTAPSSTGNFLSLIEG